MTGPSTDETLAGTLSGSSPSSRASEHEAKPLVRGDLVGRYVVATKLGAGGMGVVYRGYDPELDRKVALKLLHGAHRSRGSVGHRRLLREAQSMAKLSHPNVVAVHDVGEHEGRVYLAMEFVAGTTLGAWLEDAPRSWREVVPTFRDAGRGLAAAHAKGLIHRDFKPDNVMIDEEGRARVLDFGLARVSSELEPKREGGGEHAGTELEVTEHGTLVGTPAYMPPEAFHGTELDARSDQFSFCVALYEALYAERPFGGDSVAALAFNVTRGEVRPAPSGASVPAWLRRVVVRGLSTEPAERYPSMNALLDELEHDPTRRNRLTLLVVATLAVAALGVGVDRTREVRAIAACEDASASIAQTWDEDRRTQTRQAVASSGLGYATVALERTIPWLDAYANEWAEAREQTCRRATVEGTLDETNYARATECLELRRAELDTLVEQLGDPDATTMGLATRAATHLSPIAPCTDAARLARRPPVSSAEAQVVLEQRGHLSAVNTLISTGNFEQAQAIASEVAIEAEAIEYAPLGAAASLALGRIARRRGDYETAIELLENTYINATQAGADELAADAASNLVWAELEFGHHDLARSWALQTGVWLNRLEVATLDARRVDLLRSRGSIEFEAGNYKQAKQLSEQAHADNEALLGPDHPGLSTTMLALAASLRMLGDYDQARALSERALDLRERALGPDHPDVASSLRSLGLLHHAAGDFEAARVAFERSLVIDEAAYGQDHLEVANDLVDLASVAHSVADHPRVIELHDRALEIRIANLGPDHVDVAVCYNGIAAAEHFLGNLEMARSHYEDAYEIRERALGPDHIQVAQSLNNLAIIDQREGHIEQALERYTKARSIYERALGPSHAKLATVWVNVGRLHEQLEQHGEARRSYEHALAIQERSVGPDHLHVSYSLYGLAHLELLAGDHQNALDHASRALKIREQAGAGGALIGEVQFVQARALWQLDEREAARERAAAALASYGEVKDREGVIANIRTWIEEH